MIPGSVKDLCKVIWKMEEEYNLLEWETNGIKLWQALRMRLYYDIAERTGILSPPSGQISRTKKAKRLKKGYKSLRGALLKNPYTNISALDAAVFEGGRNAVVSDRVVDQYTFKLAENLAEQNKRFILLNTSENAKQIEHFCRLRKTYDSCDWFLFLAKNVWEKRLDTQAVRFLVELRKRFQEVFETDIDLVSFFKAQLNLFFYKYIYYRYFFLLTRPKNIYCVCSYFGMAPIIKAAKELGIRVIELQHGTFSEYHLGYSFPGFENGKKLLDYFPDEFHVWSHYWQRRIDLPIHDENVVVKGYPYLEEKIGMYKGIERKKQIVVLSQGVIGERLAGLVLKHLEKLCSFKIKYKLHPGEYERWRDYPSLVALSKRHNVSIETNADLYRLFAESEVQLGVFSTAIYEGMAFGLKTVLADLPGIEYMTDLLVKKEAIAFSDFLDALNK